MRRFGLDRVDPVIGYLNEVIVTIVIGSASVTIFLRRVVGLVGHIPLPVRLDCDLFRPSRHVVENFLYVSSKIRWSRLRRCYETH